jgi:hypothetical protein
MKQGVGLNLLGQIGVLVRCPICSELLDAPVLFSECSHVFCSRCIRLALSYKAECPSCRGNREASRLVSIPLLDQIMVVLRTVPDIDEVLENLRPKAKRARVEDDANEEDVGRESDISMSQSQRAVCADCKLPVRDIVSHGPECLGKGDAERVRFAEAHGEAPRQRQRLAKLAYNTMKQEQLKRVCEGLGSAEREQRNVWHGATTTTLLYSTQIRTEYDRFQKKIFWPR